MLFLLFIIRVFLVCREAQKTSSFPVFFSEKMPQHSIQIFWNRSFESINLFWCCQACYIRLNINKLLNILLNILNYKRACTSPYGHIDSLQFILQNKFLKIYTYEVSILYFVSIFAIYNKYVVLWNLKILCIYKKIAIESEYCMQILDFIFYE